MSDQPATPEPDLGLFPLEIVLLPGEVLPLHVFEPRYRELIGECVATHGDFGLIYQRGRDVGPVGTRASVVEVLRRYEDGRLDVLVAGGDRFRLIELTTGRSFVTASVVPFRDDAASAPDPVHDTDLEECRAAVNRTLARLGREEDAAPGDQSEENASFSFAARLGLPAPFKQELLELTSERKRLTRLKEELQGPVADQLRAREIERRASTNGKGDHP